MSEKLISINNEEAYLEVVQTIFGLSGKYPVSGEVWLYSQNEVSEDRIRVGCRMNPQKCPALILKNCYARYPSEVGQIPISGELGNLLTYCGKAEYRFMVERLKSQAERMGSKVV